MREAKRGTIYGRFIGKMWVERGLGPSGCPRLLLGGESSVLTVLILLRNKGRRSSWAHVREQLLAMILKGG